MDAPAKTLRLMAVGDILIHLEIVRAAHRDGGYDFSMLFEHMGQLFGQADLLVGNMETILTDRVAPHGFPRFATPTAVGDAVCRAGFDLVSTATNHSLDLGAAGLADSAAYWSRQKVKTVGIRRRRGPITPTVLEKNGIRVAFVNATQPTNYHRQPIGGAYAVDLLRNNRRDALRREIVAARAAADFVVALPHWGTEYLYAPNRAQEEWALFLAESGADLIVGTHPHVVQPMRLLTAADGRQVPCFYSLGNFISCQKRPATMLGALADVTFTVSGEGIAARKTVSGRLVPLVSHTNADFSYFTTYPLSEYSDELAAKSRVLDIVRQDYGVTTTTASLAALFDAILRGDAQKDNPFQSARQVRAYNIRRILKLWLTGGKSAGRK